MAEKTRFNAPRKGDPTEFTYEGRTPPAQCVNCIAFGTQPGGGTVCRLNPPRGELMAGPQGAAVMAVYPPVQVNDWCLQYVPRPAH